MQQRAHIIFLCFGKEQFFYECLLALLSISRHHSGPEYTFEIDIYTDKPDWFLNYKCGTLPINIHTLYTATLNKWKGSIGYIYRTKSELLLHIASTYSGSILYMDTDVVVSYPLDKLFSAVEQGHIYMHQKEGRPIDKSSPILRKLHKLFSKNGLVNSKGEPLTQLTTWNSGVVGIHTRYKPLLEQSLAFIDTYYPADTSIRTIEQVALSHCIGQDQTIHSALPWVQHYWNLTEVWQLVKYITETYKDANWEQWVELAANIQPYALLLDKVRYGYNRTPAQLLQAKPWQPDVDKLF